MDKIYFFYIFFLKNYLNKNRFGNTVREVLYTELEKVRKLLKNNLSNLF